MKKRKVISSWEADGSGKQTFLFIFMLVAGPSGGALTYLKIFEKSIKTATKLKIIKLIGLAPPTSKNYLTIFHRLI